MQFTLILIGNCSLSKLSGPLGIWSFPILSFLREFLQKQKVSIPERQKPLVTARNLEVWEWTNRRGEPQTLTVHREVEE